MQELDRAAISARLQRSREEAGITQQEMAALLNVHWRSIQDWESPRVRTVPFDRLTEWGELTGTSRLWLLHGDEEEDLRRLADLDARLEQIEEARNARLERLEEAMQQILDLLRRQGSGA